MRTLLIILLLSQLFCQAQDTLNIDTLFIKAHTSIEIKLAQLEAAANYTRDNLFKASEEYKLGTGFFIGGVISTTLGAIIPNPPADAEGSKSNSVKTVMLVGGILSTVTGSILMIDSHKFIRRAGSWQFTPTSITYNIQ